MSTTETLRTQLDALQVERNALSVENRKLREERPEKAAAVDLERELAEMQAENLRLSRAVSQMEATQQQRERETEERTGEWNQSVESLTREREALRKQS